jgi:hypothetical protein
VKPSVWKTTNMAARLFDVGVVEYIGDTDADEFRDRMLTTTAEALFWADATCADPACEGNCELRFDAYADDGDGLGMLDSSDRESLSSDVEGFVSMAWPYLSANKGRFGNDLAGAAGHDFQLTRNGHGAGFWDGDWEHGDALTAIAKTFGTVSVTFTVNDDDEIATVALHD